MRLGKLRDMMPIGVRASLQLSEGNLRTMEKLTATQEE